MSVSDNIRLCLALPMPQGRWPASNELNKQIAIIWRIGDEAGRDDLRLEKL